MNKSIELNKDYVRESVGDIVVPICYAYGYYFCNIYELNEEGEKVLQDNTLLTKADILRG